MRNLFAKLYNLSYTINQILELRGNMIEIIEVKTKKEIREFVDFPTKLYKGVKQYVHPLRFDEINNFNPKKMLRLKSVMFNYFLQSKMAKLLGELRALFKGHTIKKLDKQGADSRALTQSTMLKLRVHFLARLRIGRESKA